MAFTQFFAINCCKNVTNRREEIFTVKSTPLQINIFTSPLQHWRWKNANTFICGLSKTFTNIVNDFKWFLKYRQILVVFFVFFFNVGFLSQTFTNHRTAGKGEGISLTPHYYFHPLHRHLDISRAITAESSPLHIASIFDFRPQVANY